MKQRVRVAAIIRDEKHNTLLLQRSRGRLSSTPASLELPSGKINFGEQPEEAIIRIIHDQVGTFVQQVSLLDVVTFTNLPDSSSIVNLYVVFSVALSSTGLQLNLDRYESFSWASIDDLKYISIDDASRSIIDILHDKPSPQITTSSATDDSTSFDAIIFTDGGSRGNPGPSAVGYYITTSTGEVIDRGGEFIGVTSSRQAEYLALRLGVEKALQLGFKSVQFKLDNLMVVNHLTGVYQIKNRDIWPLYDDIKNLLGRLDHYLISHIKRDQNIIADAEVNKALDDAQKKIITLT